jgi:hypothetical protein
MNRYRRGQNLSEYIILIGIVAMAYYMMGPAIKRGYQSLIKTGSDQIGNQANSDQLVVVPSTDRSSDDWDISTQGMGGYLIESRTQANIITNKIRKDREYVTNTEIHDQTDVTTEAITNMGTTKD